jgi:hypothetical protein
MCHKPARFIYSIMHTFLIELFHVFHSEKVAGTTTVLFKTEEFLCDENDTWLMPRVCYPVS